MASVSYRKCPKCGYEPEHRAAVGSETCPACGLIFAKYLQSRVSASTARRAPSEPLEEDDTGLIARAKPFVFGAPDRVDALHVYARAALLMLLTFYGLKLSKMDVPSWEMASSLMHLPMVPIHEFGHVLFRPFGEFMHLLGGSLFQVGLPLIFGGIFLVRNRDPFAAAVMLWWCAVAILDVAPYVYDAQQPQHVLLTGRTGETGSHDFIDVLGDLGLLTRAQAVGYVVHRFGIALLLVALVWAFSIVWFQFSRRQ